jgi:hypothetical protein
MQGKNALSSSLGSSDFRCEAKKLASSLGREKKRRKDNEEVALCVVSVAYLFGSPKLINTRSTWKLTGLELTTNTPANIHSMILRAKMPAECFQAY